MALETIQIKQEIVDTLDDLDKKSFDKFRFSLRATEEEPRFRKNEVQKKNRLRIAELLVSRCTESGALARTIKTLRTIGCNNEALKLESRNMARLPDNTSSQASPSPKPLAVRAKNVPNIPQDLKKEAKESVLQFGQYKGKSFKWLLENDIPYAAYVVGSHRKEREDGDKSQAPCMKNKDALSKYVKDIPEAEEEVYFYREGLAPLGLKKYKDVTRQDLYNSTDENQKSYVEYLRGMEKSATKGSLMEAAIKYILHRDACPRPPVTYFSPQKKRSTRKRTKPSTQF